jgi:hypothetical protein
MAPAGQSAPQLAYPMRTFQQLSSVRDLRVFYLLAGLIGPFLLSPPWTVKGAPGPASVWGRDTWAGAGTSRILRVVSTEDLISPGLSPTASFSPGPVTVNYILVGTARDLTISITIPPETTPGPQTLEITDGVLTHSVAEALRIVDGTILNPSPSVLSLNGSAILSVAPHPLFTGQSSFSLDLGPDVSVGPVTLQPDGSLQAPVSVLPSAIPGTRSVHLTAGPYTFLAERGFAIDFGPLSSVVRIFYPHNIGTGYAEFRDVHLPQGYAASVFALPSAENGLNFADEMYVDEKNYLYVPNSAVGPSPPASFSLSIYDLSPGNFGTFIRNLQNLDVSGRGGAIESATMLPSRLGKIYVSAEDFPAGGLPGGRTITEVDTVTGESRLFWLYLLWNLDPLGTDVTGNLVFSHSYPAPYLGAVSTLDPDGNLLKTCPVGLWTDIMQVDPLAMKFLTNTTEVNYQGLQTVDLTDCTRTPRSDGPFFDGGSFAPAAGNFGNNFFTGGIYENAVYTLRPVSFSDPDQSLPERAVVFATGLGFPDGTWFDRDGQHMVITDSNANAINTIYRIPGYQPDAPIANFSATSLDFGSQDVGTSSLARTITLSNTGNATLTIASIAAIGEFSQSSTCGSEVGAGGNCTISASFTPLAPGIRSGSVVITDSALAQPHVIALNGTGIGPAVAFSVPSLDLGEQCVGSPSAPQTAILSNTGNALMTIAGIGTTGDFSQTNDCRPSLPAGAECSIAVILTPKATGIRTGAVTVTDNALGSPHTLPLTGKGISGVVNLSPASLAFAGQRFGTTSAGQTVTLSNPASTPLLLSSMTVSGDFAATSTCGASVGAGESCAISVTFTPSAVGARSGAVTITDSASGSPHTVALNGLGLGPVAALSASNLDFASVRVGTTSPAQALTLSNTGNAPLLIAGITASGDFAQTNTCGDSVAAGADCIINATFAPTAGGARNGTVTIDDDSLDSPQGVTLTGVGQDFSIGSYTTERTISPGGTATFFLKLAPQGGFAQSVALVCTGAPPAATCVVSPSSVVLDGTSPVLPTATVTTTARSVGFPRADGFSDPPSPKVWGHHPALQQLHWLLALTMLGGLAALRRRLRLGLSLALTMLLVLLGMACGGGGGSRLPSGTPAGTYTLTLTATTSDGPSHMVKVTLIVN